MTTHWMHVSLAWAASAVLLGGLSVGAIWRQRDARNRLARLEALSGTERDGSAAAGRAGRGA